MLARPLQSSAVELGIWFTVFYPRNDRVSLTKINHLTPALPKGAVASPPAKIEFQSCDKIRVEDSESLHLGGRRSRAADSARLWTTPRKEKQAVGDKRVALESGRVIPALLSRSAAENLHVGNGVTSN